MEECVHLFIESEEKNEEICLEIIKIFSFRVSIGSFFFSCDKLRQNKQQQCRHFSYVIFFLSFFFRQLSIHHPRCNYAKKKKKMEYGSLKESNQESIISTEIQFFSFYFIAVRRNGVRFGQYQ